MMAAPHEQHVCCIMCCILPQACCCILGSIEIKAIMLYAVLRYIEIKLHCCMSCIRRCIGAVLELYWSCILAVSFPTHRNEFAVLSSAESFAVCAVLGQFSAVVLLYFGEEFLVLYFPVLLYALYCCIVTPLTSNLICSCDK